MLSFGHKEVILSLYKLTIKQKNSFYKSCSVWYAKWKYGIKSKSLAVIWYHSSHFVTFWTEHQIKKNLFQKLFSLLCYLRILHKKWKLIGHFVTKQSFRHFKLNIESKNFVYKSCSLWYAIWECLIKS